MKMFTCNNFLQAKDASTDSLIHCLPWGFLIRISYDNVRLNILKTSNNYGFLRRGEILFLPIVFQSVDSDTTQIREGEE